jgi:surface protein
MRSLFEFLSTNKRNIVKATDDTIRKIVKSELDRLGLKGNLNHIDTSEVTDMNNLFACENYFSANLNRSYKFLNPDISEWDVSKVKIMENMFRCCFKFNCDISGWNVCNVEDMDLMFCDCHKFNQDLSKWNVSKVKTHRSMFDDDCPIKEEYKPHFVN